VTNAENAAAQIFDKSFEGLVVGELDLGFKSSNTMLFNEYWENYNVVTTQP